MGRAASRRHQPPPPWLLRRLHKRHKRAKPPVHVLNIPRRLVQPLPDGLPPAGGVVEESFIGREHEESAPAFVQHGEVVGPK